MANILETALDFDDHGINTLPTRRGNKFSDIPWKKYQSERTSDMIPTWFGADSHYEGMVAMTGSISLIVVVDTDSDEAARLWREQLGEVWDETTCVKTRRGEHHYFTIPEGAEISSWAFSQDDISFDVKADGGCVMAPPSPHPDGGSYKWVRDLDHLRPAPSILLQAKNVVLPALGIDLESIEFAEMNLPPYYLSSVANGEGVFPAALARMPRMKEGDGRNATMTELLGPFAGRIAKSVYQRLAAHFNEAFAEPMTLDELDKTARSIWQREGDFQALDLFHEVEKQRRHNQARRIVAAEEADAQFKIPQFRASLADDLLAQPEHQPETIIGLHRTGANALLAAPYKAGKTTLIANLARSLADGEPFLGAYEMNFEGRVALLNYELNEGQMTEWLGSIDVRNTHRITVFNLRGLRIPLISERVRDWMVETFAEYEIKAVILDPFARAFAGCGNENDNTEVGVFTDALDEIKQRANVPDLFLTHHFGRKEHDPGDEHGRGASRLDDWPDTRWLLTRVGDHRFLRVEGRGIELPETALSWDPSGRLLIGTGTRKEANLETKSAHLESMMQRVVEAVSAEPGLNTRGIQEALKGRSKTTIGKAIARAIEFGRITAIPGSRGSIAHFVNELETGGLF